MREITPDCPIKVFKSSQNPERQLAEANRRFEKYLECCAKYDVKVSNKGAYMAIGIDDSDVGYILNGGAEKSAIYNFLKSVKAYCSMYRENLMADGKLNPAVGIFWQKNYDGMRDTQDFVVAPQQSQLLPTEEELRRKYVQMPTERLAEPENAEGAESDAEE